jgi:putative addiction module killer protein
MVYYGLMLEVVESATYRTWFAGLRDIQMRARIDARIRRLALGNPGQHRALKGGIAELKVDVGPGFRVYYRQNGRTLIILLCGGDKSTQQADIRKARQIAEDWNRS